MPRRGGGPADRPTQLSKALSWLLRHHAESEGFKLLPGGFLPVADILQHRRFTGFTVAEVEAVVRDCPKQRFSLQQGEAGQLLIRANQGHSIDTVEVDLQEIMEANAAPKAWGIIKTDGLSKMKRNHIHMAAGEPGEEGVISGMRTSAPVHIHIDLERGLAAGIKFYRSANGVILSPGNKDGIIPPEYFKKVINVQTGQLIL